MRGGSSKSWYGSDSKVWAVVGTIAAAVILACGLIHMSTNQAAAEPGCTASGLSSALATVASGTAGWLASHPEAEAAVNSADENTIRTYFASAPTGMESTTRHRQSAAQPAQFLPAAGFGRGRGPAVRCNERMRVSIYIASSMSS